ncbi:MAG: cytochrome P450 [Caulobacteraceae bacterium]|nr:cytochrome P450 [Caulobacteraceae bacterium]
MSAPRYPLAEKPAHVAEALVHDVDIYDLPGLIDGQTDDIHRLWKQIQDSCPPVFWTPRNKGHWLLTRFETMQSVAMSPQLFSSSDIFIPQGAAPPLTPVNLDPPDHTRFRQLMMPAFTPAALARATGRAQDVAVAIIEDLKTKGGCEFVSAFSSVMPVVVFMSLINLPMEDLEFLRGLSGKTSPGNAESQAAWATLTAYAQRQIDLRREARQDDWISSLLDAEAAGAPVTREQILSMVLLAVSAGLGTVATTMTFFATFLATSPDHRRQLIEHPDVIDGAIEEMMRRFGVSNIARVAAQDTELDGVTVKKGESVLMVFPLAGLDESVNPDPMTVDFRRKAARHLLFGAGSHTFIGNRLARCELRIFLEEWLKRIPDFEIAPGTRPVETTGVTNHIREVQLVWN